LQTDQFDKDLVIASLKMVGEMLDRQIRAYLVGGGAMALRGEKDATKDIDLILETDQDAKDLRSKFIETGFSVHLTPPVDCNACPMRA
jgi:hypothetical protein